MHNLILQNAIWYVFCDIIIDNKLYVIMDIFVYLTLCFTSLFTLMDPLGVMPVFHKCRTYIYTVCIQPADERMEGHAYIPA